MTHEKHCIRLAWPGVESCDVCEAIRAAVAEERERHSTTIEALVKLCRELIEEAKVFCPDAEHEAFHTQQLIELNSITAAIQEQP